MVGRSQFLAAGACFVTKGGMRLAHLTDLHLPIPVPPEPGELLSKRALGYLSWVRNRRYRHRIEALERVVEDCKRSAPDLTAISGDLLNISLPAEFSSGLQWLEKNFAPAAAAFCPGNHDAYVPVRWSEGIGRFGQFMLGARAGDASVRAPIGADDFPFVRDAGPVSVVFANSSPPTLPGLATGRLGAAQISRIGRELARLGEAGRCRILVLHHPVSDGATPGRKALDDRKALRSALHEAGVELILHGHTHYPVWTTVETKNGARPVAGGGSASHPDVRGKYRPARYNLFSIDGDAAEGWRVEVDVRELDPASGEVKTAERRILLSPGK